MLRRWFVGDRCDTGDRCGTGRVAWLGICTALGDGIFAGVELDEPRGEEGEVAGRRYFSCAPGCGVMIAAAALRPAPAAQG